MTTLWFTPRGGKRGGSQVSNEHAFDIEDPEAQGRYESGRGATRNVAAVCGKVLPWFYVHHSTLTPSTRRVCPKCRTLRGGSDGTTH